MVITGRWDSLPVTFTIGFLKFCWMGAPPQNVVSSLLLVFVWRRFLLIIDEFVLTRIFVW